MVSKPIIILNHGKRKRIQRLAQKTYNKIVYRRCHIVLQLAQQEQPKQIATTFGCDISTVYRLRQAFLCEGEATSPTITSFTPCLG